jgi:hypothetical protein
MKERFSRMLARHRDLYATEVVAKFGDAAESIKHVEVFEICEYGEEPSKEFIEMLEK